MEFIKKIFISKSGVSSKRICGFLGWILCLVILSIASFKQVEVPAFGDSVLIASVTLLGVETVTRVFEKKDERTED